MPEYTGRSRNAYMLAASLLNKSHTCDHPPQNPFQTETRKKLQLNSATAVSLT